MKPTRLTILLVLGLVLTVAATGCRKRPGNITRIPGSPTQNPTDTDNRNPIADSTNSQPKELSGTPLPDPDKRKDWPRDASVFASQTVHFDFDSSTVKSSEKSKIVAVAAYFKTNSQDALEVDGHCDERGTEEYNRSLGERRALALREELVALGLDPGRIDTVSYGKDRPKVDGHDEEAWRQNRRGEFLLEVHPKAVTSP